MPLLTRYHIIGQWNRAVIFGLRVFAGIRHTVEGLENLPSKPCVICSKHQSAWEAIAFYTFLPPCGFVVKRSLLMIPFFGWGLWLAMAPIPINRSSPMAAMRSVLKIGAKRLGQGFCVVIFPEGSRTPVGDNKSFLPSAATLAAQNDVPLLPVALNSGRCWPPQGTDLYPGEIKVSIGKPFTVTKHMTREVLEEVRAWIVAETARLGG